MLPTPSTSHVDTDRVYEPAEDSYLLLDTLSSTSEIRFLNERFCCKKSKKPTSPPPLVLEVGTGSGVVLAFVSAHAKTIFGTSNVLVIGSDVNRFACSASRETIQQTCKAFDKDSCQKATSAGQAHLLTILNADLTAPFRPGVVDMLVFNPPYVPSAKVPTFARADTEARAFDHDSHLLSLSYEGGKDGMEVTNRLLTQLQAVLNEERGVAYILLCQQNQPAEVIDRIKNWGKCWSVDVVGSSGKKAGWEKLVIIRICRSKHHE